MRISGTGITTFQPKISLGFRVMTQLAIKWAQAADGQWWYTDRGSLTDIYETECRIYGLKGDVERFVSQINANRLAGSNQVTLDYFASNEMIFGADVVYTSSITATVLGDMMVMQTKLKSFYTTLRMRAISPTFYGTAAMPTLRYVNIGYNANIQKWTIAKLDTYTGVYSYQDSQADIGIFTGVFQFTDAQLRNLRRYMAVNRGQDTNISNTFGVDHPFGPLSTSTYTMSVKLLELSNEEQRGIGNWYAQLKMAEMITA
jgi:hypothetical protein